MLPDFAINRRDNFKQMLAKMLALAALAAHQPDLADGKDHMIDFVVSTKEATHNIKLTHQRWLVFALSELGKNDPLIYQMLTYGPEASCSAFVAYCLLEAGYQIPAQCDVQSWIDAYKRVVKPEIGDITILVYDGSAHVGFYLGEAHVNHKNCFLLLGYHSDVSIKVFPHQNDADEIYLRP